LKYFICNSADVLAYKLLFLLGFATDIASIVMMWSQKSIPLWLWSRNTPIRCTYAHHNVITNIDKHILHCTDSFLHLHNMFALAAFTRWCCSFATLWFPLFIWQIWKLRGVTKI